MMTSNLNNETSEISKSILNQYESKNLVNKNQLKLLEKYSINLLWINRTINENQEYILPPTCGHGATVDSCLSEIVEWKQSNPEALVNLWFDSRYVTAQSIKNTQKRLQDLGSNEIFLRDIRDIPIVKNNPDVFTDNLPIYFRVDLMKFIICLHAIEDDKNQSAIVTDFLIGNIRENGLKKMKKEELFSPEALGDLEKFGIKVGLDCMDKLENQFFQVMPSQRVLDALKFIINICINTAVTTLKFRGRKDDTSYNLRVTSLSNLIYDILFKPDFLKLCQEGLDKLTVQGELFDPERHGYDLFGNTAYGARFATARLEKSSIKWSFPDEETNLFKVIYKGLNREDLKEQLGRKVYATKIGNQHNCDFSELIQREPESGSYTANFIPIKLNHNTSKLKHP